MKDTTSNGNHASNPFTSKSCDVMDTSTITSESRKLDRTAGARCTRALPIVFGLVARVKFKGEGEFSFLMKAIGAAATAIPEREGENSGDLADPFFHHFQILRAHCDLIRPSRHDRDGWSVPISSEFLTRAHPVEQSRRLRATKKKRLGPTRNLFEMRPTGYVRALTLSYCASRDVWCNSRLGEVSCD